MSKTLTLTLCALVVFSSAFTKNDAMKYLFDFKHISALEDEQFESGLKDFQKIALIPITGSLDQETKRLMQVPRCFNPNPEWNRSDVIHLRKRYAVYSVKWSQRRLHYHMIYPKNVNRGLIDRGLRRAFNDWAFHTGLRFINTSELAAHLTLGFIDIEADKFGYAYSPDTGGGRIKFNSRVQWSENTSGCRCCILCSEPRKQSVNFYQVALHEIGHALGLLHSNIRESVMYEFYSVHEYGLHQDDILGIKSLYNYT